MTARTARSGTPGAAPASPCAGHPEYEQLAALPESELFERLVARAEQQVAGVRHAHPRHHGLVRARLEVDVDPAHPECACGLFARPGGYPAYVRLSNSDPEVTWPDPDPDARGMAIKVLGVDGPKLGGESRTQDFVLVTHPVFMVRDMVEFACFQMTRATIAANARSAVVMRAGGRPRPLSIEERRATRAVLADRLAGLYPEMAVGRQLKTVRSLLTTPYWSETPYTHGPEGTAVKIVARPHVAEPDITQEGMTYADACAATVAAGCAAADYLRADLIARLAVSDARFDLLVQPRLDSEAIEDAVTAWRGPEVKVATLVIPSQMFATEAQHAFGARIDFNPWHALPAHRPLGAINRFRRELYPRLQRIRHAQSGVPSREPTGHGDFQAGARR